MSTITYAGSIPEEWTKQKLYLFRFGFILFALQILPWDIRFYKLVASINWKAFHFKQIFDVIHFLPSFFSKGEQPLDGAGLLSEWSVLVLSSLLITLIWSYSDKQRKNYKTLWYMLRVVLRYKLAFVFIAYGFYKWFQLQMPFPSLSHLHTPYGDYKDWKIYFQTIGITPEYESFIGALEIAAGLLLLFRKTSLFGAGIALGLAANVFMVNFFYHGHDLLFSGFVLMAVLTLISYDVPRLYRLLILQRPTAPEAGDMVYTGRFKTIRYALKTIGLLFFLLIAYTAHSTATTDPFKLPKGTILANSSGYYNVQSFVLNRDTIPYSLSDSLRWQNVVFEKWPTVSIRINRELKPDESAGDSLSSGNLGRTYELAGVGGRHYFDYSFDTTTQTLSLRQKNKHYSKEGYEFHYTRRGDTILYLKGVNHNKDSLYVELRRQEVRYLLQEGLRKPIKL